MKHLKKMNMWGQTWKMKEDVTRAKSRSREHTQIYVTKDYCTAGRDTPKDLDISQSKELTCFCIFCLAWSLRSFRATVLREDEREDSNDADTTGS